MRHDTFRVLDYPCGMCGRFSLHGSREELRDHFHLETTPEFSPRYNIAPSQEVLAVRRIPGAAGREASWFRWGLLPAWSKDSKTRYSMINARAETVADKPAFRKPFRSRRCLIPADGFYEWQKLGGGAKQPWYFYRADGGLFAFAGLWDRWEGSGNGAVESCTIVVTAANELVEPVHDRMPAILAPEDYQHWLDPENPDPASLTPLLRPFPEQAMAAHPVTRAVNDPRNEGPRIIDPP